MESEPAGLHFNWFVVAISTEIVQERTQGGIFHSRSLSIYESLKDIGRTALLIPHNLCKVYKDLRKTSALWITKIHLTQSLNDQGPDYSVTWSGGLSVRALYQYNVGPNASNQALSYHKIKGHASVQQVSSLTTKLLSEPFHVIFIVTSHFTHDDNKRLFSLSSMLLHTIAHNIKIHNKILHSFDTIIFGT